MSLCDCGSPYCGGCPAVETLKDKVKELEPQIEELTSCEQCDGKTEGKVQFCAKCWNKLGERIMVADRLLDRVRKVVVDKGLVDVCDCEEPSDAPHSQGCINTILWESKRPNHDKTLMMS